MGQRLLSVKEITKHSSVDDLWILVDGTVYDVTAFAPEHPGGLNILLQYAGRDATLAYSEVHSASLIKSALPSSCHLGRVDTSTITKAWATPAESTRPSAVSSGSSSSKPPLETLLNAHDFERAAEQSFTPKAWAFVSSAATDCVTKAHNVAAYRGITLRPRVLVDVGAANYSTTMLGHAIRSPLFCAATSMGRMFHPQGERELGRACRRRGVPQLVSTSSSFPFGEVVDAHEEEVDEDDKQDGTTTATTTPRPPVFFQLYMDKNRAKSAALLRHVQARGAKGVFLTVDAPVIGKREADERIKLDGDTGISSPMTGVSARNDKKGGALGRVMGGFIDPTTVWDDIAWIRECAPGLPVVLKGVQTAADAVRAMEAGVDGILLSNHGGRSLDTAPATILVLLELQKCCPQVFDRMEVYVDGGISRGTDIFKALCLGAKAVGIGRGFLYALNYAREGIEHFIDSKYSRLCVYYFSDETIESVLNDELQTTMQMCGITSLDQVHPGLVHTGAVDHLVPSGDEHPYARWRPRTKSKL
jgi:L-lactate dehydrogenase (cytochrome)